MLKLKVIYDPETGTLTLLLRDAQVRESDEIRDGIIIDYAEDGKAVSLEILDASKTVAEPYGIL